MKLAEILAVCDLISPFEMQESWDNSGLIIGDPDTLISSVVLSLEADKEVIKNAPDGSALIVHHPLIFSPLKQLDFSRYPANLIRMAIEKNLSIIALHTNFDKTHLNKYVAKSVLNWSEFECDGFLCTTSFDGSFADAVEMIKKQNITPRNLVATSRQISSISLCTGSGASLLNGIKSDLLITGDLKYHDAVLAQSLNIGVIDIGHYESERYFGEIMQQELMANGINAIIINSKNPFYFQGQQ